MRTVVTSPAATRDHRRPVSPRLRFSDIPGLCVLRARSLAISPARSLTQSWAKRARRACCPTSTSPSTVTQLEAWASLKSFQRTDAERQPPPDDPGNPTVNFHGERRSNRTHRSTTDPDTQLFRKGGTGAVLSYLAHALLDNRHGLVVNTCVTAATGTAEWDAVEMLLADCHRGTVGGDKNYDVRRNVRWLRQQGLTPHVAAKRRYSPASR